MGCIIDSSAPAIVADERAVSGRVSPVLRFLPSLTDAACLLTLAFLFTTMNGTHSLLGDGDTGWHIRTGQWILSHGQVPHQDIFSYTVPGRSWFAWEWLWDVTFATIYNHAGLAGVVMGSLAVLAASMMLLFRLVRRKCGNVLIAFGVTGMAIVGSSLHWLARPHLLTLLFGIIFYSLLERVKDWQEAGGIARARRLLWLLPPLMVLWTNLHGGFLLGIILLASYGAGDLLGAAFEQGPARRAALARCRRYFLTAAGCLAASAINPYFLGLHRHILEYLSDKYAFEHIAEFQTLSFHSAMAWVVEAMIVLGAVAAFREAGRRQFVYVILIVGWTHLGLMSGRNIPILMLIAAPVIAWNLGELAAGLTTAAVPAWLGRRARAFAALAAEMDETDRVGRLHLVSLAALVAVGLIIYAPAPPDKFRPEYDPKKYPAKALQFLGGPGISNRIFTDDEWGDYVLYTLYPTKVFIDGRSDMYGGEFCQRYLDAFNVKYDWRQTLARYGVDTILLSTGAPLVGALKESRDWRVVYDDGVSIVFRPWAAVPASSAQASAVPPDGGAGRDRKITKSQARDRTITKTTT